MAITANVYGQHMLGQYSATAARRIDWVTDTIKAALLTSSYTADQDNHDFFDDVSANEITGTGYTAGGATLSTKSVTYDGTTNIAALKAANTAWSTATLTFRYAIVYKDTGTASTSPLIFYVNFGADQSLTAGTFTLVWNGAGLVQHTVA